MSVRMLQLNNFEGLVFDNFNSLSKTEFIENITKKYNEDKTFAFYFKRIVYSIHQERVLIEQSSAIMQLIKLQKCDIICHSFTSKQMTALIKKRAKIIKQEEKMKEDVLIYYNSAMTSKIGNFYYYLIKYFEIVRNDINAFEFDEVKPFLLKEKNEYGMDMTSYINEELECIHDNYLKKNKYFEDEEWFLEEDELDDPKNEGKFVLAVDYY